MNRTLSNKKKLPSDQDTLQQLKTTRERIAVLDEQILGLVGKRLQLAKEIGLLKKKLQRPVRNQAVEKAVYQRNGKVAEKVGLNQEETLALTKLLMEMAVEVQTKP